MNKIIKRILIFTIFILSIFLINNQSKAAKFDYDPDVDKYKVNDTVTVNNSTTSNFDKSKKILCADINQRLNGGGTYKVRAVVDIFEKNATGTYLNGKGKTIEAQSGRKYYNAYLAYYLYNGSRTENYFPGSDSFQYSFWWVMAKWRDNFGGKTFNLSDVIGEKGWGRENAQDLMDKSKAYASSAFGITNNSQNVKAHTISNSDSEILVGPFNYVFGGSLRSIAINGSNITNVYNSTGKKATKVSEIKSGNTFYIKVPSTTTTVNITLNTRRTNIAGVKIAFLDSTNSHQNLIVYERYRGGANYTRTNRYNIGTNNGSLKIEKVDSQTKQPLANVQFTLKMTSGEKNGQYVTVDTNGNAVYNTTKQTIKTDSSGEIDISNLWPGTYELIETVNPHYGYENLPEVIDSAIQIKAGETVTKTVENTKQFITISGHVWEDISYDDGKETIKNGLYNQGDKDINDKFISGITVKLKDTSGKTIQTKTTEKNGIYKLTDVSINMLSSYYIEFSYNGMAYENVTLNKNIDNGNKVSEGNNRANFNNNYEVISKGKSNKYNLNYKTENYTSKLIYGEESKYNYGYSGNSIPISGVDEQYIITANTKEAYGGYLDKIMTKDYILQNKITEIDNINLGLAKREQPDLSLVKDLESVKVTVNNESHIYKYADRFNPDLYDEYGGNGHDMEPQVKFGQKYGSMSYTRGLYASDIYNNGGSDLKVEVTYKIGVRNSSSNLIAIVNELTDYYDSKYKLIGAGKEIEADGSIKEGTEIVEEKDIVEEDSEYEGYKKYIFETNLEIGTQKESCIYIRLEVLTENIIEIIGSNDEIVKLDNIAEISSYSILDGNRQVYGGIDSDSQPGNLEIDTITTYEDDTDKAPGLKLVLQEERKASGKIFLDETGELQSGQIRQGDGIYTDGEVGISGVSVKLVDINTNEIAKVYDQESGMWKDAIKTTNENGEYTIGGFLPGTYKIVYTWGDSTYKVQDYKSTIIDKNVYNAKNESEEWYKDEFKKQYSNKEWNTTNNNEIRTSDAIDNYDTRLEIDAQTSIITNSNKQTIEEYDSNGKKIEIKGDDGQTSEQALITKMDSSTPNFKINIEYSTNEINSRDEYKLDENGQIIMNGIYAIKNDEYANTLKSIDFGIVERAKQILKLDKQINTVKIVLANGSTLVDAKIIEDENGQKILQEQVNHTVYIPQSESSNGQIKIEIDDEIIQGTTLEMEYGIKVINISELDYINQEFYLYGKGYGENQEQLVKLDPKKVIDYLDNNITTDIKGNWDVLQETAEKSTLIEQGLLNDTDEMKKFLKETGKVILTDQLSRKLSPIGTGESEVSIENGLKGYKLLSSSDETIFENNAEIIEIEKNGGASLVTIPGNYIPNATTPEADSDKSESIVIVPPTGISIDYIGYTLLAITSLGIFVAGIISIKKYVLG